MNLKSTYLLGILLCLGVAGCKEPPAPLPEADFFIDGDGCFSNCKVDFYDQSLNAVQWNWDFGNGTTSANQHDSATYTSNDVYTVTLTVWNTDNVSDSRSKSITIY